MNTFDQRETFTPLAKEILGHGVEVTHVFCADDYAKVFSMPAGTVIGQHKHKRSHQGVLLTGEAAVMFDGRTISLSGPAHIEMPAGVQHSIRAVTACMWACVWKNPMGLTRPDQFDKQVIESGPT